MYSIYIVWYKNNIALNNIASFKLHRVRGENLDRSADVLQTLRFEYHGKTQKRKSDLGTHQVITLAVNQLVVPQVDRFALFGLLERQQRVLASFFPPGVDLPVVPCHVRVVVFDVRQVFVHVTLTAANNKRRRIQWLRTIAISQAIDETETHSLQ